MVIAQITTHLIVHCREYLEISDNNIGTSQFQIDNKQNQISTFK